MIAALYVQPGGVYYGLPHVEPWGLPERDARDYAGPWPVVAHPPCSRWCRLAGLVDARWGHKRGDDGGCFAAALAAVRRWGGVLEHPAYTDAWAAHDLTAPPRSGGWTVADWEGGWACHVEQGQYGHKAKKATWLYAVGCDLPSLRWGSILDSIPHAYVSWCRNRTSDTRIRVGKRAASATPTAFRDVLIAMAESVIFMNYALIAIFAILFAPMLQLCDMPMSPNKVRIVRIVKGIMRFHFCGGLRIVARCRYYDHPRIKRPRYAICGGCGGLRIVFTLYFGTITKDLKVD